MIGEKKTSILRRIMCRFPMIAHKKPARKAQVKQGEALLSIFLLFF